MKAYREVGERATLNKMESYIAGMVDGDGSIFISRCTGGYQLMVDIHQSNAEFLGVLNEYFEGHGRTYVDGRAEKYLTESASKLRFAGKKTVPILTLMSRFGIIKAEQADLALEYVPLVKAQNREADKERLFQKMKALNKDKSSYEKPYDRMNDAYIAGIFDAEGNVYLNRVGPKLKYYVKITQKCDPGLVEHIQRHLGHGCIYKSEPFRIRFESQRAILNFHERLVAHLHIKKAKLTELVSVLNDPTRKRHPRHDGAG